MQKFASATMVFDLCFNSLFEKIQNRIHKQILGNLSSLPTFYYLLNEALKKMSVASNENLVECDPILDALYTVFCISPLDGDN